MQEPQNNQAYSASFRDNSGYIFQKDNLYYRYIAASYLPIYQAAVGAGLFSHLQAQGLLLPHSEVELGESHAVLLPEQLDFVSYPYEWSFSQYKDAALATLQIQEEALKHNFTLKDATAFNIQFHKGKPIFIDTLSFEPYVEGQPWVAYRQFCEHFLAPLALMALSDIRLAHLFRPFLGGVPLDLASKLLPWKTRFNMHLYWHVHLHAKQQEASASQTAPVPGSGVPSKLNKNSLLGIVESLKSAINSLTWTPKGTEWGDYYANTNYSSESFQQKKQIITQFLGQVTPTPTRAWDCGGNTGEFSRILSEQGIFTVSWDIDPAAVEKNYRQVKQAGETTLLPLLQDLTNPSGAYGWNLDERLSFIERGPVDVVLALALIHHLAISNNVPLGKISAFFAQLGSWLIIEFVPKEDSQTQKLLAHRKDIFDQYDQVGFEAAFSAHWDRVATVPIPQTKRTLYLLKKAQP